MTVTGGVPAADRHLAVVGPDQSHRHGHRPQRQPRAPRAAATTSRPAAASGSTRGTQPSAGAPDVLVMDQVLEQIHRLARRRQRERRPERRPVGERGDDLAVGRTGDVAVERALGDRVRALATAPGRAARSPSARAAPGGRRAGPPTTRRTASGRSVRCCGGSRRVRLAPEARVRAWSDSRIRSCPDVQTDDDIDRDAPPVVIGAVAAGVAPLPFLAVYAVLFIARGTVHPVTPPDVGNSKTTELIAGLIALALFIIGSLAAFWLLDGRRRWLFVVCQAALLATSIVLHHRPHQRVADDPDPARHHVADLAGAVDAAGHLGAPAPGRRRPGCAAARTADCRAARPGPPAAPDRRRSTYPSHSKCPASTQRHPSV